LLVTYEILMGKIYGDYLVVKMEKVLPTHILNKL
jgi:hypothetical protein